MKGDFKRETVGNRASGCVRCLKWKISLRLAGCKICHSDIYCSLYAQWNLLSVQPWPSPIQESPSGVRPHVFGLLELNFLLKGLFIFLFKKLYIVSPCGLTFTWWGCYGLCLTWTNWACPLLFILFLCVFLSLSVYGPINCISFHEFSWQLSVFSLCSFDLVSVLLVLSTTYLFMKVGFSPEWYDP